MLAHLKQKHRDHHHQLQQQKQKQKQQQHQEQKQKQKQQLEHREFQSDKIAEPQPAFGVHKMPKALTSKDSSTTTTDNNDIKPNTDGISVHKAEATFSPPVSSEASGTTDDGHQSSSGATATATNTPLRPLLPLPTSSESQEPDNNATTGACAATKMTCDALCSLSYATINHNDDNLPNHTNLPSCDYTYNHNSGDSTSNIDIDINNSNNSNKKASHRNSVTSSNSSSHKNDKLPNGPYPDSFFQPDTEKSSRRGGKGCPKQHQLPMFLSKTYHMIDRCDPSIATWSPSGDNFVVKNVEKFASTILPMYFKHSNFSSFARQLNFYGFRKLKAEPILTADFDARTACYVRFYHEHFQKNRPELLAHIKRATKSDQQSKDDVETLKIDIIKLKETIHDMSTDYDRRMTEMSYEYNRRITALSAEYDKLAMLVQQLLASQGLAEATQGVPNMMHSLSQVAALSLQNSLRPPASALAAANLAAAAAASVRAAERKRSLSNDDGQSDLGSSHNPDGNDSNTRQRLA